MKKFSTTIAILAFSASTFINPALSQDKKGFEVSKNMDLFNTLYKELEMYNVDTINTEETIKKGVDAMLGTFDP